jgi:CBS domain containing-hemolysin-like protein
LGVPGPTPGIGVESKDPSTPPCDLYLLMAPETLLLASIGLLLVLLNGFFVAAEFAIVKLRLTQAQQLARSRGVRGRVLQNVRTHLDAYLSACQLGITLASLGLGWIGEPAFARLLEPPLRLFGITDPDVLHGIAFTVAFALISFLHIVLGELAPKSVAIRKTETLALQTALPLYLFYWLMYPFIFVLNGAANFIVRRMGVELASEGDTAHSLDELRSLLLASHHHGELGPLETRLLVHALELRELVVGDLMRPLAELQWIPQGRPIEEVLAKVRASRYTRYPLRDPVSGRFVALLHIKDLVATTERLRDIKDLRPYLRELPLIRENTPLPKLLLAFRQGSPHLAMVTDELGTEIGFVTFEHVVEALLGPVEDEFSKASPEWQKSADGGVVGHGSLSILSLEDALGLPMPPAEANSVGGLVIEQLGRIPAQGECVRLPGFEIRVLAMQGRRVERVSVRACTDASRGTNPPEDQRRQPQ